MKCDIPVAWAIERVEPAAEDHHRDLWCYCPLLKYHKFGATVHQFLVQNGKKHPSVELCL